MNKIIKETISSEGLKKSVFFVGTNLFATLIAAISLIIFSRILGPAKFGEFSVGASIIFILVRLTDLGSTQALLKFIPIKSKNQEKNSFFSIVSYWRIRLSLLILVVACLIAFFAFKKGYSAQPSIVYGAILLTLVIAVYEHISHLFLSLESIAKSSLMNIIQAITKLSLAMVSLWWGFSNTMGSFLSYSLSPLVSILFGIFLLPNWVKLKTKYFFQNIPNQANQFITHSAIGVIAVGVMENISILQLRGMMTDFETGIFGGISRISLFVILGGTYLSQALFPRVAKYSDSKEKKEYFKKAFLFMILICSIFIIYLPFNDFLLKTTLGADYLSGSKALMIMMAAGISYAATIPLTAIYYSGNKYWYFSLTGIIQILVVTIGNMLIVPEFGLIGAAGVILAARLIVLILTGVLSVFDVFLLSKNLKGAL